MFDEETICEKVDLARNHKKEILNSLPIIEIDKVVLKMSFLDCLMLLLDEENEIHDLSSFLNAPVVDYVASLKPDIDGTINLACYIAIFLESPHSKIRSKVENFLTKLCRPDAFNDDNASLLNPFFKLKDTAAAYYYSIQGLIKACIEQPKVHIQRQQSSQAYSARLFGNELVKDRGKVDLTEDDADLEFCLLDRDAQEYPVDPILITRETEVKELLTVGLKVTYSISKALLSKATSQQVMMDVKNQFLDWINQLINFLEKHDFSNGSEHLKRFIEKIRSSSEMPSVADVTTVSTLFRASVTNAHQEMQASPPSSVSFNAS